MKRWISLSGLFLLTSIQIHAQGTVLGEAMITVLSGASEIRTNVVLIVGSTPSGMPPTLEEDAAIFDNMVFFPTNVGSTFEVSFGDHPDFPRLVQVLTNGVADSWSYMANSAGGSGLEPVFFNSLPPGNGVDFEGYRIESFLLEILEITLTSPGQNPNGNGMWTDLTFRARLDIVGEPVPEPSPAALVSVLGSCWLVKRRWQLHTVRRLPENN